LGAGAAGTPLLSSRAIRASSALTDGSRSGVAAFTKDPAKLDMCAALARDETLEVGHLFAGFKQNTGDLVLLGVLTVVGWILALIPAVLIAGGGAFMSMMMGGEPIAHVGAMGLSFFLALLVVLALAVPLYMALWFAPSLIVFNQLKPVDAMKTSFYACLKNIVPFLIYGVIAVVLCLIAAIPFGLGFLVLGPVLFASIYTGYRDIFSAG